MKRVKTPIRLGDLLVKRLLFVALFVRPVLGQEPIEPQSTTDAPATTEVTENAESAASVPAPAPAPPRKQFIDPFSGMPLPEYSYTNSLPVPSRWRTLTVDPFSGVPFPTLVTPAPKPKMEEESEPEFIPPVRVELPPGSYVARGSTRQIPSAVRPVPRLWEMLFSETRWDFPPGTVLRRK